MRERGKQAGKFRQARFLSNASSRTREAPAYPPGPLEVSQGAVAHDSPSPPQPHVCPQARAVGNSTSIINRGQSYCLFPWKLLAENLAKLISLSGAEDTFGEYRKGEAGHEARKI